MRITNRKGRTVFTFDVAAGRVSIIGVFYGGQNYETLLQSDMEWVEGQVSQFAV